MDPLALLICAVITMGVAWVVAQPLVSGPEDAAAGEGGNPEEHPARLLQVEKEILYQSLHELDLDYAAGKLSEADYRALRAKQESQAVALLKAIDAAGAPEPQAPSEPTLPRR
jgi:hypothetical protein